MMKNGVSGIDSKFARKKKVERMRSDKTLLHKLTGDPRLIGISIEDLRGVANHPNHPNQTNQRGKSPESEGQRV